MPSNSALLVIDVQAAMFHEADPVYQGELLLENIKSLVAKARQQGHTVVYIQHNEEAGTPLETGTPGWQVHPSISPLEGDLIIQKWTPDSFHQTELHEQLQQKQITDLILTGMQTDLCVDTTCRRASSLGYKLTLVRDAHSTWNSGSLTAEQIIEHHNNTLRWFAKLSDASDVFVDK